MNLKQIKGIIELGSTRFQTISLKQRIMRRHIESQLMLKMMYHLSILIHELNFRQCDIPNLNLENIYIRSDKDSPDVFIDCQNISEKSQTDLFKKFINILKQVGLNPLDIKKMKDEKLCTLVLLEKLQLDRKQQNYLLKDVYGLEILKQIYDHNDVLVVIAKTPYYIINSGEIAIKMKLDETKDPKFRSEIDNLIKLQIENEKYREVGQQKKFSKLFCYCVSPIQKVLFQEKYGHTLEDLIQKYKGKISNKEKIFLCRKMAYALESVHKKKIIHRDIKPQNIMVTELNQNDVFSIQNLECTIIDFDSSKGKDEEQEEFFQSTAAYRPPENLQGNNFAESYDICQLGLTFLYIVQEQQLSSYGSKVRPFPRQKYEEIIGGALENVRNTCSELYLIIGDMLNYDPNQRISLQQVFIKLGEKLQN